MSGIIDRIVRLRDGDLKGDYSSDDLEAFNKIRADDFRGHVVQDDSDKRWAGENYYLISFVYPNFKSSPDYDPSRGRDGSTYIYVFKDDLEFV